MSSRPKFSFQPIQIRNTQQRNSSISNTFLSFQILLHQKHGRVIFSFTNNARPEDRYTTFINRIHEADKFQFQRILAYYFTKIQLRQSFTTNRPAILH